MKLSFKAILAGFVCCSIGYINGNINPWEKRMPRSDQYYYDNHMDSAFDAMYHAYINHNELPHSYLDSVFVAGCHHYNKAHGVKNEFLMRNK